MDFENHVGKEVGIHHMFAKEEIDPITGIVKKSEFEKKYNQRWREFFTDRRGERIYKSPKEILDFAKKMVEKYGMDKI